MVGVGGKSATNSGAEVMFARAENRQHGTTAKTARSSELTSLFLLF